jgi:hypothetical protein
LTSTVEYVIIIEITTTMEVIMPKKTTTEFIRDAKLVHGNKYNYSKTEYRGHRVKVEIICPRHGSFWQRPDVHVSQKSECPRCRGLGMATEDRFWSKVNKNGPQVEYMEDPCWEWIAGKATAGYGTFDVGGETERVIAAHVYSYELHFGPIPRNENGRRSHHVCHRCDNKSCVNPNHLFAGNDHDNMSDAAQKGRLPHKLRPSEVRAIRELYSTGNYKLAALGRLFNVNPTTIKSIVIGKHWKHVK